MRIVFSALPGYGHVYPMLPLALACVDAGHKVTFATGVPFVGRLPLPTTYSVAPGKTFEDFQQAAFQRINGQPSRENFSIALFGDVTAEHCAAELITAFSADRPDLVVYEASNVGAAIAAEVHGVPAVAFGLTQWHELLPVWHETAVACQSHRWRTPPPNLLRTYIDPMPPTLASAPMPSIAIRPVPWSESHDMPELGAERPCVYVTLGTVAFGMVEVLRRAIVETVEHDVEVVVAVGPEGKPEALGALPSNVHVERFVSQPDVMRQASLVIHHGGSGTMLGALANGLPQLILPQGADQFFNAEAIKRIQAGDALLNDEQVPGAISATVGRLLSDCPERVTAKRVQKEIAEMPAPADIVDTLVASSSRS